MRAQRLTQIALLAALGAGLHWVEGQVPLQAAPGVKLGIANLATLVALYRLSPGEAVVVSLLRSLLGSILAGSFSGLSSLLSLVGAVASVSVMMVLWRCGRGLSIIGVSVAGGVIHNLAQLSAVVIITSTPGLVVYLPVLIISGLLAGLATGNLARRVITKIETFPG
ncbi:hypothetical protein SY88_07860 [Clostridiales bacterium PH28_bin88]|nr:hypothetical protein SY88_07860 [Clostridiales bacterium PH28_bin88]